eukprot:1401931-Pleurochrysis_carterae.AAC.1
MASLNILQCLQTLMPLVYDTLRTFSHGGQNEPLKELLAGRFPFGKDVERRVKAEEVAVII